MSTIYSVDYDLIHHCMDHPSHNMLKQVSKNTEGFPSGILILMDLLICYGCAQGKMHLGAFPDPMSHMTTPFCPCPLAFEGASCIIIPSIQLPHNFSE